ncbi:MAG TPA: biopolymer transporter ExbD [Planctomycetaceae bacterium]|nr:biopolymer transporter ExbD [Planctomycetaceae bacterium]
MKLPTRSRGGGLRFNLTPMIDVVFNLIIFFLAASHLARSEIVADVELPEAATGGPEEADFNRRLIVTILGDGTLNVSGRELSLPQVEQLLPGDDSAREFEVRIRTDRRVPYRHIEPLLLACARAGIAKVRFAVLPAR